MDYINYYTSLLGKITMASNGTALTGLWLEGQLYYGQGLSQQAEYRQLAIFEQTAAWLDLYFAGQQPEFTLPLALTGTAFQLQVWELLQKIPYGQTTTYGALAAQIAEDKGIERMSAQAVGGAVGRNPISIIIPCHRVLGSKGQLTGYAGGVEKKSFLLELEGARFRKI